MHGACHLRVTDTVVDHDATELSGTTQQEHADDCLSSLCLPSEKRYLVGDDSPPKDDVSPTFACPFWKFNPAAHRTCFSRQLSRIRDVKRHLFREHMPSFYCTRCLQVFEDGDKMVTHVRLGEPCSLNLNRPPPFVTRDQWRLLRNNSRASEAQPMFWYSIYAVLFPGQRLPSSPYLDAALTEDLTEVRDFYIASWFGMLQDILHQLDHDCDGQLIASVAAKITPGILGTAIDQSFNRWTSQRLASRHAGKSELELGPGNEIRWSGSTFAVVDSSSFGSMVTCFWAIDCAKWLMFTGIE